MTDVLVIGGGVFGLTVAFAAHRAGLAVRVLEANRVGAGASGGLVGALAPHAPTRWRPMMSFQFEALVRLERHAAALAELTGLDPGYARTGRVQPLADDRARARAEAEAAAAPGVWGPDWTMRVDDRVEAPLARWIAPEAAPAGVLIDDLSARIAPRAYLAALQAALPGRVVEGSEVHEIGAGNRVIAGGATHEAAHVVVAAGWRGWPLLSGPLRGSGVKGQAALLAADGAGMPVISGDGLYVVPHGGGRVAVGSTSEKSWRDAGATDGGLELLIDRARGLVPALRAAPVVERWAGVRPKPPGREPVIGPVPGRPGLWVAGGGYKIGFGIAHMAAETLVAMIRGRLPEVPLPPSFAPAGLMPGSVAGQDVVTDAGPMRD